MPSGLALYTEYIPIWRDDDYDYDYYYYYYDDDDYYYYYYYILSIIVIIMYGTEIHKGVNNMVMW